MTEIPLQGFPSGAKCECRGLVHSVAAASSLAVSPHIQLCGLCGPSHHRGSYVRCRSIAVISSSGPCVTETGPVVARIGWWGAFSRQEGGMFQAWGSLDSICSQRHTLCGHLIPLYLFSEHSLDIQTAANCLKIGCSWYEGRARCMD